MARKIILETRSEPALYTLFGISCHLKDYRLSFLLNQGLDLEFIKMEDFRAAIAPRKEPDGFSFYFYRDEDRFNAYYLLANRGEESVLLPELRQTDFLLLLEGPCKKAQKDHLLSTIKAIPNVLTAFEIRFETIRNYENFLTDLEIHFMTLTRDSKVKYSPLKK
jgi:hypothetical protein